MATKQRASTKLTKRPKRAATGAAKASGLTKASGAAKAAASNGGGRVRRVRMGRLDVEVHEPAEQDPQKRAEAIRRAATRIKTTAVIDSIHPGQEY
jgi:hypothetical protein